MEFEWDEAKNQKNIRKHQISFQTAMLAFADPLHIAVQDRWTAAKNVGKRLALCRVGYYCWLPIP